MVRGSNVLLLPTLHQRWRHSSWCTSFFDRRCCLRSEVLIRVINWYGSSLPIEKIWKNYARNCDPASQPFEDCVRQNEEDFCQLRLHSSRSFKLSFRELHHMKRSRSHCVVDAKSFRKSTDFTISKSWRCLVRSSQASPWRRMHCWLRDVAEQKKESWIRRCSFWASSSRKERWF